MYYNNNTFREVSMSITQRELLSREEMKTKRRRKLFSALVPDVTRKAKALCCAINGCPNEAITFKGKMPNCGQHK